MQIRRILAAALLAVCLMLPGSVTAHGMEEEPAALDSGSIAASGEGGENITWTLDDQGRLTVSGTGRIWGAPGPWSDYAWQIRTAVIEEGITDIGAGAFKNCSGLTSVKIPEGVVSIEREAFYGCGSLSAIELPKSLRTIENSVFQKCTSLTGIDIPEGVTAIQGWTFNGCTGLVSVKLPSALTEIGDHAFYKCSKLASLDIPESVTSIGQSAFYECSGIRDFSGIPEGVTEIQDDTFYGCSGITGELVIPDSVTSIGSGAFYECSGFTGPLVLPERLTHLGSAFGRCSGFTGDLRIPEGVTSIASGTFTECSGFNGVLTLGDQITSIGSSAFYGCSGFTGELRLPKLLTSIGEYAFTNCSGFTGTLTIPGGVERIAGGAFCQCEKLTSAVFPDTLRSIGERSFSACYQLSAVLLPNGLESMGEEAFYVCRSLPTVTIPAAVSGIGDGAFAACDKLTEIAVDPANQNYKSVEGALYSGDGTVLIQFPAGKGGEYSVPEGVSVIQGGAFQNGYQLEGVIFPSTLTEIGDYAFYNCYNMKTVSAIPDSVQRIGARAFAECFKLTDLEVSAGNQSYCTQAGVLFNREMTELITYPAGKKGAYTVPDGVAAIKPSAFAMSGLTSVTLPRSLRSIEDYAFAFCRQLKTVFYEGSREEWGEITVKSSNEELLRASIYYDGVRPVPDITAQIKPSDPGSTGSGAVGGAIQVALPDELPLEHGMIVLAASFSGGRLDAPVFIGTYDAASGEVPFAGQVRPGQRLFFLDPVTFQPLARASVLSSQ